jgi:histone deacetylase 6
MKSTLEERIKRADDISKAYKHFRLEVRGRNCC